MVRTSRQLIAPVILLSLLCLGPWFKAHAGSLDAGSKMPEIGLSDLSGKSVTAASLGGKVVVVDFWATWCAPCREELPVLQKLYKKYAGQGPRRGRCQR